MIGISATNLFFLAFLVLSSLIFFQSRKFPRILFLLFLVLLSYTYVDLADYEGYLQMYNGPKGNLSGLEYLDATDIGFRALVYLGNFLNIEFEFFKAIIYFTCGIILIKAIVTLNNKSANLILALYMFYPLLLDIVQVRHFIAMTLFLYVLSQYLSTIKLDSVSLKKKYFLFILPVLFHASFAYLVLIVFISNYFLAYVNKKDFILKNIFVLLLSVLLVFLSLLFLNTANSTYLLTSTSTSTVIFYTIVFLVFYLILMFIRHKANTINHPNKKIISYITIFTTILIGTTWPMLFFHVEFFRFFRVELILVTSVVLSVITSFTSIRRYFYTLILVNVNVLLSFIIFSVYYQENIIYPLLLISNL